MASEDRYNIIRHNNRFFILMFHWLDVNDIKPIATKRNMIEGGCSRTTESVKGSYTKRMERHLTSMQCGCRIGTSDLQGALQFHERRTLLQQVC